MKFPVRRIRFLFGIFVLGIILWSERSSASGRSPLIDLHAHTRFVPFDVFGFLSFSFHSQGWDLRNDGSFDCYHFFVLPVSETMHICSYSDGSEDPVEVVRTALRRGVKVLALTDHDQLRYSAAARALAAAEGLLLIQGVEISCEWVFRDPAETGRQESKVHLLGYFLYDEPNSELKERLEELQRRREDRNFRILQKLKVRILFLFPACSDHPPSHPSLVHSIPFIFLP